MTRSIIVLSFTMMACLQKHDAAVIAIDQEECVLCHQQEYDATTTPVHATAGFPASCVDCHRTSGWMPALDGLHPDIAFPIAAGAHSSVKCLGCHDLDVMAPSTAGANTNCVQCHPDSSYQRDSHVGALGPSGQTYAYTAAVANFCLTCHPKGTALKHPNDRFPRTGPHATSCTNCHDRSMGPDTDGMNTTCIRSGCHSLGEEDGEHNEVSRYSSARGDGSNRHFCLLCHPSGRN